jgi:hypothetical protein
VPVHLAPVPVWHEVVQEHEPRLGPRIKNLGGARRAGAVPFDA